MRAGQKRGQNESTSVEQKEEREREIWQIENETQL